MRCKRMVSCCAYSVLLVACAAGNPGGGAAPGVLPLDTALVAADNAARSGQGERALAILTTAAGNNPASKTPWLRIAQLRFDNSNYGEAIVAAQEVVQRDPDDKLAHSIIVVSGLRLASKALSDLSQKNNLSGSVRSEAQDLAKLLRTSLGEEVLVPPVASKAAPHPVARKASTAHPKQAVGDDPFGALK